MINKFNAIKIFTYQRELSEEEPFEVVILEIKRECSIKGNALSLHDD